MGGAVTGVFLSYFIRGPHPLGEETFLITLRLSEQMEWRQRTAPPWLRLQPKAWQDWASTWACRARGSSSHGPLATAHTSCKTRIQEQNRRWRQGPRTAKVTIKGRQVRQVTLMRAATAARATEPGQPADSTSSANCDDGSQVSIDLSTSGGAQESDLICETA